MTGGRVHAPDATGTGQPTPAGRGTLAATLGPGRPAPVVTFGPHGGAMGR